MITYCYVIQGMLPCPITWFNEASLECRALIKLADDGRHAIVQVVLLWPRAELVTIGVASESESDCPND